MTQKIFDAKAESYAASKINSWDKLRYDIWTANIEKYIPATALHVLDAGGGDGLDTVAWAQRGHKVTLLDTSTKMLEQAQKRAKTGWVADEVMLLEGEISSLPSLDATFDLILCHNVLPYLKNVSETFEHLRSALKPNGLLSVVCLNRYSEPFRQAVQQEDIRAALQTLDRATYTTAAFGVPITLFTADEVISLTYKQGFELETQYGVRCVNDYVPNDAKQNYEEVLRLDLALTERYPYFLLARFFQLILKNVA